MQIVLMFISLIRLLLSLLFVLPGDLMVFPLSAAISYYTEQERIKALKGSVVKIKANDVRSTVKIVAYISTYPIYLVLFTLLFNRVLIYQYSFTSMAAVFYSWIFFWMFPLFSLVSIRSHDGVKTHYTDF
jgi:hypothetical protein